ncbi:MAG: PD-(D/E)XK nuclease family protein, partial [Anaerolineales bacterium]
KTAPARLNAFDAATSVHLLRNSAAERSVYEGDLSGLEDVFARRFEPGRPWSASRLEAYARCPFMFFVGSVLGLEEREEPTEGLDARQLGNIYHRIFEQLYPAVSDPTDLEQLIAVLPDVASEVLDGAPQREGFRVTAWWRQTRDEMVENVRRSLEALAELQADFVPLQYEAAFGIRDQPPLVVRDHNDSFALRGLIDRVDRAPDGRLRVIDYKTSGPWGYSATAVADGKKLQLPLYALAAQEALKLGEPAEGFYWHVRQAEPSSFKLSRFSGGPQEAMAVAVSHAWESVREARQGNFVPSAPDAGCPAWCAAALFCWQFKQGYGG